MLRTLIDYSRLLIDTPWLMFLVFAVVILPGGILLTPVLASKVRHAKAASSNEAQNQKLVDAVTTSYTNRLSFASAKRSSIPFVPSVGKVQ